MPDHDDTRTYLAALFGRAPGGSLIELRWRARSGMDRAFVDVADLERAAVQISRRAIRTDVYVGVLPRRRRGGRREDLLESGCVLWADCDSAAAVAALDDFRPAPSMIVASGSAGHRHAYWLLPHPVSLVEIEGGNGQLARALGADLSCVDAARILRPPSLNHKLTPPAPVTLERCDPAPGLSLAEIVGPLPPMRGHAGPRESRHDDPLLDVPPAVYVEALAGVPVPRHRKVHCPFHSDRTPSLHVYDEPQRGWYCFGCRRGGSVYDFGAALYGLDTRGDDFRRLQQRLDAEISVVVDLTVSR